MIPRIRLDLNMILHTYDNLTHNDCEDASSSAYLACSTDSTPCCHSTTRYSALANAHEVCLLSTASSFVTEWL